MIDRRGTWSSTGPATPSTTSRKHDEHLARSHTESQRCSLTRSDWKTKQFLVKRIRAGSIRFIDSEVIEILHGDQSLLRRWLHICANFTESARAAAVLRVGQLNYKSIRIAEKKFRCSVLCAAVFRSTHTDAHLHRSAAQSGIVRSCFRDAVLHKNAGEPVCVEVLRTHAKYWSHTWHVRSFGSDNHKLRDISNLQLNRRARAPI